MYTPDEKKQLEQLEWQATSKHYETAIKQVVGGYVISHKITYVSDGVILGVTTNQYVANLNGDVREVIAMLYKDDEFQPVPADYVTSPPPECPTADQYNPIDALKQSIEDGEFKGKGDPALHRAVAKQRAADAAVPETERSFSRKDY
jgi:hypothetical protein